ncbi:MAG: tetratricopeptide repeat protein [Terracidiphilus sp.]
MSEPSLEALQAESPPDKRLDSWKEIAGYLNRDVTTVQRWEKREAMPVHRHVHAQRGSVYALRSELDAWRDGRSLNSLEVDTEPAVETLTVAETESPPKQIPLKWIWLTTVVAGLFVAAAVSYLFNRQRMVDSVAPKIHSIAVLPFKNLSGDPAQEYLAAGVTEALIGRLSGIHELRVISRTSVMRFKDSQTPLPTVARMLGVDAIVEGSVIREGSRVRVTAQLIRGSTDTHIWSAVYDRELEDALTLESDVAQSIARKVEVTVTEEENGRLAASHIVDPEVYESYLKGRFASNHAVRRADFDRSIGYYQDAIAKDPTFAPAYVGLAECYNEMGTVLVGAPPGKMRAKSMEFARKALALDPELAEPHVLLGGVLLDQWRWAEARAEFARALDLSPNDAGAEAGLADWLLSEGHPQEALAAARRARDLDPMDERGFGLGWYLFHAREYDEAIRDSRSMLAVNPDSVGTLWILAFSLMKTGHPDQAIPLLERAKTLSGGGPAVLGVLVAAYAQAGRRTDALKVLAELNKLRKSGYAPAAAFVNAYLGLGDKEQAFQWLERAYKEQSNILKFLKVHPGFDPIRSDPRFADLVHRVGLG